MIYKVLPLATVKPSDIIMIKNEIRNRTFLHQHGNVNLFLFGLALKLCVADINDFNFPNLELGFLVFRKIVTNTIRGKNVNISIASPIKIFLYFQ